MLDLYLLEQMPDCLAPTDLLWARGTMDTDMNYRHLHNSYQPELHEKQPLGATFFVTFCLADTIPQSVLRALNAETKKQVQQITAVANTTEYAHQYDLIQRQHFGRWDSYLDAAEQGPTWLRAPQAAQLIGRYLLLYVDQRYELGAFCIMPNHVHLLIRPLPQTNDIPFSLTQIIESLKAETAVGINRILGRNGQFWHPENYTHIIRDAAEAQRVANYIVENPVKASLATTWEAWPWTYVTRKSL